MASTMKEMVSVLHADALFSTLRELYQRHLLTDVALIVDGLEFRTHMVVLAAYSPLFKDVLNKGGFMGPYYRHHVTMTSSACMELLLEFLYTGTLQLTQSIAQLMFLTAQQLQIESAAELCQKYLEDVEGTTDIMLQEASLCLLSTDTLTDVPCLGVKQERDNGEDDMVDDAIFDVTQPLWDTTTLTRSETRSQGSSEKKEKIVLRKPSPPKHKCGQCGKLFQHYSSMTLHCKTHNGSLKHTTNQTWLIREPIFVNSGTRDSACPVCRKIFTHYSTYRTHYLKRHARGPKCKHCDVKFPSRNHLLTHQFRRRHSQQRLKTEKELLHMCRYCARPFRHEENYLKHIESAHPCERRPMKRTVYQCPECQKNYKHMPSFRKHLKQHKLDSQQIEQICGHLSPQRKKEKRQPGSRCEQCPAVLPSLRAVRVHMTEAHPGVCYPCRSCTYQSVFKSALIRHAEARHGEDSWTRTCEMCDKVFNKKHHLIRHKFSIHGIRHPSLKLHPCSEVNCEYVTYNRSLLTQHMRMHSGPKTFRCDYCQKFFRTKGTLKHHVNILHLNIRPCICELCGATFGSESELTCHTATHDQNRRFKCEHCPYSAQQKLNLRNHLFLKHNILMDHKTKVLQCDKCGFQTVQKHRFDTHVEQHAETRTIPCKFCDKLFRSRAGLRSHVDTIHKPKHLKCEFCDYRASLGKVLKKHTRVVHTHPNYKPYKCGYCEFLCATSQNCRKHVKQRHSDLEVKWVRILPTTPL